ncbi:AraC family transcriptional regulator [Teredinibacter waterburyi]|uniref:AraC family transcriptional regulator n=1 Tax=Teredinibacter waterburyi TaxID=1500538 RepID=UPI00165FDD11|nr:helix-turn-helix domain-containing protein [Teredinibacter waterburyi]
MKSPIFNLHDVFIVVTVVQSLFLALFQLFIPTKNRLATLLLSLFFVVIAISSLSVMLFWGDNINVSGWIKLYLLPYLLVVSFSLKGPFLYYYVLSLTSKSIRITSAAVIHLVPVVIGVFVVLLFHISSDDLKNLAVDKPNQFVWNMIKLLPPIYAIYAVYSVHRYQYYLKRQYSSLDTMVIAWLYFLTLGFSLNWFWSACVHLAGAYIPAEWLDSYGIADNYITLILVVSLFIVSFSYSDKLLITKFESDRPIKDSEVSNETRKKIIEAMEEGKVYLDGRLNIESFSKKIDANYRDVSAVINKEFNTNFFDYVNMFRVDEAIARLADESKKDCTILDILLESGFNSRSAFHRFWKRRISVSPSEFRRQVLSNSKDIDSFRV